MTLPADYTPPTLEQRLDAAAEEWRAFVHGTVPPYSELRAAVKAAYREHVISVCRAFAPEHFKDTDTTTGKD